MPKHHKKNHVQHGFGRETSTILSTTTADNRIYKRRLALVGTITSDAVNRINTVITMNPSTSNDWASVSALYDEFRVVGCRLQLVSRTQNTVTLASNAVFVLFDNDDTGVLTSYDEAANYQNSSIIPALFNNAHTYKFKYARPSAGMETSLPWSDIATPATSLGAIKMYADTLSATTNYFSYMIEWAVEFRGVR